MNDMFSVAGSQGLLNRKTEDFQHFCDSCLWLGHERSPPGRKSLWTPNTTHCRYPCQASQSKCTPPTEDAKVLFSMEEQQVSLVLKAERLKVSSVRDEKNTAKWDCCCGPQPLDVRFLQAVKTISKIHIWTLIKQAIKKKKKKAVMKGKRKSAYRRFQEDMTKVNLWEHRTGVYTYKQFSALIRTALLSCWGVSRALSAQ